MGGAASDSGRSRCPSVEDQQAEGPIPSFFGGKLLIINDAAFKKGILYFAFPFAMDRRHSSFVPSMGMYRLQTAFPSAGSESQPDRDIILLIRPAFFDALEGAKRQTAVFGRRI
jgi:hypothetical protein